MYFCGCADRFIRPLDYWIGCNIWNPSSMYLGLKLPCVAPNPFIWALGDYSGLSATLRCAKSYYLGSEGKSERKKPKQRWAPKHGAKDGTEGGWITHKNEGRGGTEGRARRLIVNTRQHVSEWVCRSDAGSFDQCLVRTWCADLELDEGDGEGELAAALESREIVDESWIHLKIPSSRYTYTMRNLPGLYALTGAAHTAHARQMRAVLVPAFQNVVHALSSNAHPTRRRRTTHAYAPPGAALQKANCLHGISFESVTEI
ncbi:hypothetical protein B0H13DRAFT_1878592 [Mycena leptocephala]|nr:hypothetical protein B0H13DRAFT_1878592 [Mycena leptocephala]